MNTMNTMNNIDNYDSDDDLPPAHPQPFLRRLNIIEIEILRTNFNTNIFTENLNNIREYFLNINNFYNTISWNTLQDDNAKNRATIWYLNHYQVNYLI